jgi:hypothetical protein
MYVGLTDDQQDLVVQILSSIVAEQTVSATEAVHST